MLTLAQVDYLKSKGFINYEIRQLNSARDSNGDPQVIELHSQEWRIAIKNRADWATERKRDGMTRKEYEAMVKKFIEGKAKDEGGIFIFLREQYGRVKVVKMDYKTARGNRAKKLIGQLYKGLKKRK